MPPSTKTNTDGMARLFRGAAERIGTDDLPDDRPLIIKVGFDPTAPGLHLGHTVVLTAMRRLQDAGHHIIFLIGDFTARIGDPTGRDATRPPLSDEQIATNTQTYVEQVSGVLDMDKAKVRYNSEWLGDISSADLIRLAGRITLARMLERDGFGARHGKESPISLHELLYPLAQGWDSVILKADVEMGGTDQKFNMLLGRDLQRQEGQNPQAVITWPLLPGTDGVRKMSKSLDNCIAIADEPKEMFGRLMSISDELMWQYYNLLSLHSEEAIADLQSGAPLKAKMQLAEELVGRHWGEDEARQQQDYFVRIFCKGKTPNKKELTVFALSGQAVPALLANTICEAGLATGAAAARRLIRQGAVRLDDGPVQAEDSPTPPVGSYVLQVGKRRIIRLEIRDH